MSWLDPGLAEAIDVVVEIPLEREGAREEGGDEDRGYGQEKEAVMVRRGEVRGHAL